MGLARWSTVLELFWLINSVVLGAVIACWRRTMRQKNPSIEAAAVPSQQPSCWLSKERHSASRGTTLIQPSPIRH
jgi:hypothetical protein